MPGCRVEAKIFLGEENLQKHGLRVIAVDRPGYGLSSRYQTYEQIRDIADNIVGLADHLKLTEPFAVIGVSGDGLSAAACAALIPIERLAGVLMYAPV
jgi:pimeloyl-ACP methyl ester carboxylesterase